MIDKYYMCHYTKLSERKVYAKSQLDRFNIEAKWINSFDKEDIGYSSLFTEYPKILNHSPLFNRKLSKSEISLCLKHIEVFKDVISNSYQNVVVFEDDIILVDDFDIKLNEYMKQLPKDYDILWIGSCCNLHADYEANKNIYKANSSRCTHTYLISNSGCRKMISQLEHLNHPIDWYFNFVISQINVKNFWAEPDLSTQNTKFETTIQNNKNE
jgi:GR25 family glycosyltransferase involved in LPS biosynthesis